MYKRLWIISAVIFLALSGLCVLGFYSISLHAQALVDKRTMEFTDVAEQIRLDIKRKLDDFIKTEQQRPYTDYQYFYVPQASNEQNALLRSPLGDSLEHGLAYGHFQIDPDGTIQAPFYAKSQKLNSLSETYISNIRTNLLGALNGSGPVSTSLGIGRISLGRSIVEDKLVVSAPSEIRDKEDVYRSIGQEKSISKRGTRSRSSSRSGKAYQIESLKEEKQQTQIINQRRSNVIDNTNYSQVQRNEKEIPAAPAVSNGALYMPGMTGGMMGPDGMQGMAGIDRRSSSRSAGEASQSIDKENAVVASKTDEDADRVDALKSSSNVRSGIRADLYNSDKPVHQKESVQQSDFKKELSQIETDIVQIRIEPFVPVVVPNGKNNQSQFNGQVFLLRHVQIERKHFLQGFKLNELELVNQVKDSARRLIRSGMGFEVGNEQVDNAAHAAIIDFGFADLGLNLVELDSGRIANEVGQLRNWYFSIIAVVFIAVILAMLSLWRNLREQLKLARKKDDFISAVSHELRTPLTTIRMYTEMLDKNWIKTDQKRNEYYSTMLSESERLSRLIENVLDFSRIQKKQKKYNFKIGNVNDCVNDVVDMMTPCAQQAGFIIHKNFTDSEAIKQIAFDSDAVMQIVINLLDNAVKYAASSEDKIIAVTTKSQGKYVLIEVADHGPGIPHRQQKKIFDEFYRIGDESRRETTGTGLGLALVKKFAQAHNGFVEILNAKPTGAVFRVALAKGS